MYLFLFPCAFVFVRSTAYKAVWEEAVLHFVRLSVRPSFCTLQHKTQ